MKLLEISSILYANNLHVEFFLFKTEICFKTENFHTCTKYKTITIPLQIAVLGKQRNPCGFVRPFYLQPAYWSLELEATKSRPKEKEKMILTSLRSAANWH